MSAEIISKEPPALDIKLETVTPERAAVLLKGNTHNRSVNANYVQTLAREMTEGRWKVNGDSIRMNGSTLIDGQHRLTACILSGQSFDTLVLTGLESDVFDTIDNGRKRTAGDVLSITGEKNATTMAAALSVVARYKA